MGSSAEELWEVVQSAGPRAFVLGSFSRLRAIDKSHILHWLSEPDNSGKLDVVLKYGKS
jgi:hypothetical protein